MIYCRSLSGTNHSLGGGTQSVILGGLVILFSAIVLKNHCDGLMVLDRRYVIISKLSIEHIRVDLTTVKL